MLILIIVLFITLLIFMNIRIHLYKMVNSNWNLHIILFKIIPIKIDIDRLVKKYVNDTTIKEKKASGKIFYKFIRANDSVIKKLLHNFTANKIYFRFDFFKALENPQLYFTSYYIYSFTQNYLLIAFRKIKKTCFKTSIVKKNIQIVYNIDIETRLYRLIFFYIKYHKSYKEAKLSIKY